ncbi:MAG: hypothetical protein GOV01_00010 [Candidatus Altiarchaeota archaeon]|nr:hypothetical protein [Candidatus Altiarchaeota archaeon]
MDTELLTMVSLMGLVFIFVLPQWTLVEPSLEYKSASLESSSFSFSVGYSAPFRKACYVVVYGPFVYDKPGHEVGNNIYVLTTQQGTLSDTLTTQLGANVTSVNMELWCDHDKLKSLEIPL